MELPPDSSIVGSNFYNVAESSLLAWMTGHCTREYGTKFPRITNFDTGEHGLRQRRQARRGPACWSVHSCGWPMDAAMREPELAVDCARRQQCVQHLTASTGRHRATRQTARHI